MNKILVEVRSTANNRKVLALLPDQRLLERLAAMQSDGTTLMLLEWLAQCREDIHARIESPSNGLTAERAIGAAAALGDIVGILHDPRTLLDLSKRTMQK